MDKYEYQVCADQIKTLIKERHFSEAMDIADTIDWRRVKSFSMLCTVSEIYKVNKHYSEARDILLLAYERYPDRANVVYALCELAIKLDDVEESIEYYKEYVRLKPHDYNKYVLLYKIYEAQEVPLEEKISLLEEFKRVEYTEKWAYELALLYHKDGQETRCVETCDELVLWFGEGPYVRKALELKMQHAPLTKEQQRKYDGVYDAPAIPKNDNDDQVHIYETQSMNAYANGASPFETAPINQESMESEVQKSQEQGEQGYQGKVQPNVQNAAYQDINVRPLSTDKYSTINLQEELARNMEEFYSREKEEVGAPYYGSTAQLYEPSQEQFLNQINQAGPVVMPTGDIPQQYGQPVYQYTGEMPQQYGQSVQQYTGEMPQQYGQPVQQYTGEMPQQYGQPVYQYTGEMPQQYGQPVYQHTGEMPQQYSQPVYQYTGEIPQQAAVEEMMPGVGGVDTVAEAREASDVGGSGVPKELEDKLREGLDGQVTFALPDAKEIERQLTGQIDLDDFMKDLEEKKKNAQEQRLAQIKAKGMEQTGDIMAQLVGVIPGLDSADLSASGNAEADSETTTAGPSITEEVLRDDKKGVTTKTTISSPTFDRGNGEKRTESGVRINGPVASSLTGEIPDILPSSADVKKSDVLPSGHRLTIDEEYGGNLAQIRQEDEKLVKQMTGELPVEEELPPVVEEPVDYGETEEIEDVEQPEISFEDEIKPEDPRPVTGSIPPLNIPHRADEELPEHVPAASEESIVQYEGSVEGTESVDDSSDVETAEDTPEEETVEDVEEPVSYPYEIDDDLGEVEELTDLDQPEEVDDILKTRPLPIEEIEARQRYEAGFEEEYAEPEPEQPVAPAHIKSSKEIKSSRDFEDVERAIFGRFEGIERLKAQIVDVMDYMSMDPRHGNVVVIGSELFGRKEIAIDVVKATQTFDKKFLGKVAKISGEALNKKNIPVTLSKLKNGALIVENAGGLSPITVNSITEALLASDEPVLVVFEGEKDTIEPLLNGCVETRTVFDARIIIDDFSDDDLVAYAKGYAREQEYSIDEMGTLALHTKIADMQTYDHVVSIQEVMEIVDNAIRHVDKKNMSHFMDVLVGKRYDKEDFIVLREKDFMI